MVIYRAVLGMWEKYSNKVVLDLKNMLRKESNIKEGKE